MKNIAASFTLMAPQHSVEKAYHEWVIKAVELIVQSRVVLDTTIRPSRQFALNLAEKFDSRQKILCDPKTFFLERAIIAIHVIYGETIVERWVFSFDSPRDVIPTTRSERRDLTLPRRLAVALRSLMCLTRILRIERDVRVEVKEMEEVASSPSLAIPNELTRIELCSIPSSFGILTLKVFTLDSSKSTTRIPSRDEAPDSGSVTPNRHCSMVIDETFMQTHSLGNIEIVIETTQPSRAHATSVIPVPLSKSPPRDLAEIWPTSSLSYPASPRERIASADSGCGSETEPMRCCLVPIPHMSCLTDSKDSQQELCEALKAAFDLTTLFERPVSVSSVIEFIDQLKRSRQKSCSSR